jgi:predicted ATP-dependent serine protease
MEDSMSLEAKRLSAEIGEEPVRRLLQVLGLESTKKQTPSEITFESATRFSGEPTPDRDFHVPLFIPGASVTLLYGDGGTGKSTVALQLSVATVLARMISDNLLVRCRQPCWPPDPAGGRA